ncbi:hypothetical protein PFISCL1PPCAC_25513, partial [Pristionchus fissidentatus]
LFSVLSVSSDIKTVSLSKIQSSDKQFVVRMALLRDKQVISHLAYPAKSEEGEYKVRVDSFFPFVFQSGEKIRCVEA